MTNQTKIGNKEELMDYATHHGSHFFDRDTLQFFSSRILETVVQNGQFVYFVTSEQFTDRAEGINGPRKYSIRCMEMHEDGTVNVNSVGQFQKFATSKEAIGELHKWVGY